MLPESPPQSSICQRTGLDFIPLFSPAPGRPLRESTRAPETPTQSSGEHEDVSFESLPELSYSDDESCESCEPIPNKEIFTSDEIALFEKRLEEGFDLDHDNRYNLWLSLRQKNAITDSFHVALLFPVLSSPCKTLGHKSMISKLIDHSVPSIKMPQLEPKSSARVLTSNENRRQIMEKERVKKEKEQEKKERAALREEKRQERLLIQEEKKRKKEERIKEQAKQRKSHGKKGMLISAKYLLLLLNIGTTTKAADSEPDKDLTRCNGGTLCVLCTLCQSIIQRLLHYNVHLIAR